MENAFQELVESHRRMDNLFHHMTNWFRHTPSYTLIIGPEKEISFNERWFNHLNYPRRSSVLDLPGTLAYCVHPDDISYLLKELNKLRSGGPEIHHVRIRVRNFKEGGWQWQSWHASYSPESHSVYCIGTDIQSKEPAYVDPKSLQKIARQRHKTVSASSITHFNHSETSREIQEAI